MKALAVCLALALLTASGCGRDGGDSARNDGGVVTLVPGPVSAYSTITVTGPSGPIEVTGELREAAVPVRAARSFARPYFEYGLDQPQGTLQYVLAAGGKRIDLSIGGPTFDARGVYVARSGEERVYLVFVDRLRPVLAAAGISVPEGAPRELPPS